MRKTLAAILAFLFALSLCACKDAENALADSQAPATSQAVLHTTESNEATTTDAVTTETTTETTTEITTEITTEDTTTAHTHSFFEGKCISCGEADPDYQQAANVWIPTNGGKKYHKSASCSNMKNPEEVTKSEAEARGFDPCKRCY